MASKKITINNLDINKLKVISDKDSEALFLRAQAGDENAKDQLVKGNMKLVLSLIKRFSDRTDNIEDLFQVGCIGLIKSIDNFDVSKNLKFSTYAVPMINGEIKRYLRDNNALRISRQIKDLAYQIMKEKEDYLNKNGVEPTNEYLAKKLNVKEYQIKEAIDSTLGVSSLQSTITTNYGDNLYLLDQISDESFSEDKMINLFTLQKALTKLNEQEKKIINDRFFNYKTQMEIAEELDVSQAQISRIEKDAIKTLKSFF